MSDDLSPKPAPGRGRPFAPGRSGNPSGRRRGSRNKATLAAAALLAGESEGLTRKAVEMALAGDPLVLRPCLERVLPRCRERAVKFRLPPIAAADRTGQIAMPTPQDVARAMNAVTAALARGELTPGEAATIAGAVDTFVRAIETTAKAGRPSLAQLLLQILMADDEGDDDFDDDDYDESGDSDPPR